MKQDGVSVIIPALDEERGLAATLATLSAVTSTLDRPCEIIVVDDGSKDDTRGIATAAGARVIVHPRTGGYGRSLKSGLAEASHELIVITDADGTYPVQELPTLLSLAERFDMVVGARTGPRYQRSVWLSPVRTSFLLLTSFVTGTWIPDPNSGFRVFRRSQVLPLVDRLPNGFSFTTTTTVILMLDGRFIHFHPIAYAKRIGRSKVRFIRDALRASQGLVEVILAYNPLKLFMVVATLPLAVGVVCALAPLGLTGRVLGAALGLLATILVFALGMLAVAISPPRRPR